MTDPRSSRSNGRVAHVSMRGLVEAERFVDGADHIVTWPPAAALCDAPFGGREREVLWGHRFCVLEVSRGWAFGFAQSSGYTGYIEAAQLTQATQAATHRVQARASMALSEPDFKAVKAEHVSLSLGSLVTVLDDDGRWARIAGAPHDLFVPSMHLSPVETYEDDAVSVVKSLLGTPYVWGGNSAFGIDCSGLVQIACEACALPCPGDSDQQCAELGETVTDIATARRGDLLFWKGHVAWVADNDRILHANAHAMSVCFEGLHDAIARIEGQGGGPVLRHARLS